VPHRPTELTESFVPFHSHNTQTHCYTMSRTRQPVNLQPQSTTETSRESSTLRLTGTLRLRAEDTPDTTAEPSPSRRIRWSEDVVDNEGMGKKSSKGKQPSPLPSRPSHDKYSILTRPPHPSSLLHLPQSSTRRRKQFRVRILLQLLRLRQRKRHRSPKPYGPPRASTFPRTRTKTVGRESGGSVRRCSSHRGMLFR
jgi:hypothetical protein